MALKLQCFALTDADEIRSALEQHHAATVARDERYLKKRDHRPVTRVQVKAGEAAVKEYRSTPLRAAFSPRMQTSRARASVRGYDLLAENGFTAAAPLAVVEERRFGLLVRTYLLTGWLELPRLKEVVREALGGSEDCWKPLIRSVVGHLVELHAAGILIEDHRLNNLFLAGGPEEYRIVVVDTEKARQANAPGWRRLHSLHQLRQGMAEELAPAVAELVARTYLEGITGGTVGSNAVSALADYLAESRTARSDNGHCARCRSFYEQTLRGMCHSG
jgi:hypothetical protein